MLCEYDKRQIEKLKTFKKQYLNFKRLNLTKDIQEKLFNEKIEIFCRRMRGEDMSFLFEDDICWCANECDNLNCFRNLKNRKHQAEGHNVYTAAYLKDTEYCPSVENLEKS